MNYGRVVLTGTRPTGVSYKHIIGKTSKELGIFLNQSRRPAVVAGADLLRMSREDLIQICGPADGIRLFNTLKGR